MKIISKNINKIVILLLIGIFAILSFKKIYSSDTLVPNLEPYPDSLYYSVPAWNFVHGNGFVMKTQNTIIKQQTPPLYGIYLTPFFALFKDARSFYFANMILAVASIIFFVLIIETMFVGKGLYKAVLIFFLGFFLVTNFYFYTIPQLLMAEPITIFLVTLGIYLFVSKPTILKTLIAGQIGFLLILVKLSNLPYGILLTIMFFTKYFSTKYLKTFLISFGVGIVYFLIYIFKSKLLFNHKNLQGGSDFNFNHLKQGLTVYARTLFGKAGIRYLWFTEKFVPTIVVCLSILGFIVGVLKAPNRKVSLFFLIFIFIVVLFMSFFVVQDLRYIIAILPIYLASMGYLIQTVSLKINDSFAILFMLIVIILSLFLKSQGYKENERAIITFKKQIGLNLRHREVPWNYEAVKTFNKFTEKFSSKTIYIGTFLPAPYVEMFSNKKYKTLPISSWQEFYWLESKLLQNVIGGEDIAAGYKKLLLAGDKIYISHYYESNVPSQWPKQIKELTDNFVLTKVYQGCLGSCDIYQLK